MRPSLRQVLFRSAAGLDLNFAGGVFSLNNTRTDSPANIPGWSFSRTDTNGIATALDLAGNVIQFPSRTNVIRNSVAAGATAGVVGSGGALPTNWGLSSSASSFTTTVVGTGTEAGLNYVEIRFESASAPTSLAIRTETSTGAVVTASAAWIGSLYASMSSGSASNITAVTAQVETFGGAAAANGSSATLPATLTRYTAPFASTPVGTTFGRTNLILTFTAGGAVDITVRLAAPQLETGSTATAYIPTTTAAVTVVLPRITNRGILVEEARTNKGTSHNANPTEAAGFVGNPVNMSKSGDAAGILSVVDDAAALAAAGLSGACTSGKAYKLDNTAGAANAIASINGTVGNLNAHAFSCYARATAGSGSVGRSGSSVGAATFSSSAYARASAVLTPTATTEVLRVQALPGAVVYFILAQVEEGSFATSPIITTGAAGTRGADAPVETFTLPVSSTVYLEFENNTALTSGSLLYWDDGAEVGRITISKTTGTNANIEIYDASGTRIFLSSATLVSGTNKIAVRAQDNNMISTCNGASSGLDTAGSIPSNLTRLRFARNPHNNYTLRCRTYPAMTTGEMQALTAP